MKNVSYCLQRSIFLGNAAFWVKKNRPFNGAAILLSALVKMKEKKVFFWVKEISFFHINKKIELNLEIGTRLSLFPLKDVVGISSEGLKYGIKGFLFSWL